MTSRRITEQVDSVYWVKGTDEWRRSSDNRVICPDHANPVIPCPYCGKSYQ